MRFEKAKRGEAVHRILGSARMTRQYDTFVPTVPQAEAASKFRGKVQPHLRDLLLGGRVMQTAVEVIAADLAMKWRPRTQSAKHRAAAAFQAFLVSVGMLEAVFPASEDTPTKTKQQTGMEEDLLTGFAMNRAMAGQALKGVSNVISHVRTWYELLFGALLGTVGCYAKASPTSQHLKSMSMYYPIKEDSTCRKRAPLTQPMVSTIMSDSRRQPTLDKGAAVLVAYAGLFRMGELTSTEGSFDPVEDLSESDLTFVPNFWTATHVKIQLGRSKADQDGQKSKLRPRILPVDDSLMSPGGVLRDTIAERKGLRRGTPPLLGKTPLFQDGKGGQLKQRAVLDYIRLVLRKRGGLSMAESMEHGTHSCRIGGASKLFQLGATPEVFKHLGGWSSDAYKIYVQIQQADLMGFARRMCAPTHA